MASRRLLLLAMATVLVGLAGLGASVYEVLHPRLDRPARADAVVLLSGDRGERLPRALGLIHAGFAPTLVIDGVPDLDEAKQLCRNSPDFEVVCILPSPDDTRTEAGAAGRLARSRRWRRLIVVTDEVHISRSRMLFDRCVDGTVLMVAAPTPGPQAPTARSVIHELLGTADALTFARGC